MRSKILGLTIILCVYLIKGFAQPPKFSYSGPQNYTLSGTISPLQPAASGSGIFPTTIYGQVKTIAGKGGSGGLADGPLASATFLHPGAMCADGADLYFSDGSGTLVRKLSNGIVTTVAGSTTNGHSNGTGTSASFSGIWGIAARAGTVYVIEQNYNTIRRISPGGVVTTFAGSTTKGATNGTGIAASFNYPAGITLDGSGNLYVADGDNYLIRKVTSLGVVTTFAGSGAYGSVNGTATAASFTFPYGIVSDAAGNLFVTDGGKIRKITAQGVVSDYTTSTESGHVNGPATTAILNNPYQLALDKEGNLYAQEANDIRKISPQGLVSTFAGNQTYLSIDGIGPLGSFGTVTGIAVSTDGALYATDYTSNYLRKVDLYGWSVTPNLPLGLSIDNTGTITGTPRKATPATAYTITATTTAGSENAAVTIATVINPGAPKIAYSGPKTYPTGTAIQPLSPQNSGGTVQAGLYNQVVDYAGNGYTGSTNGTLAGCSFNSPYGLAYDGTNILVAELYGTIRKITPEGIAGSVAGADNQTGSSNGREYAVNFNRPTGLATDYLGNIYVADASNNAIRKIDPTGLVTTFAGTRATGAANGAGSVATFAGPSAVACDAAGNVFVADERNNLIRKITPAGVVSTFAGSSSGYADGVGTAAKFNAPTGLTFGPNGDLYVVDGLRIRKITPGGIVSTFAGSGASGTADGSATVASFKSPVSIAYDQAGSFYVTDSGNLIRKIAADGTVSTLVTIPIYVYKNNVGFPPTSVYAYGIVVDPAGVLYFSDVASQTIRKIALTGYTINPALPPGLVMDETGTISGTPTTLQAAKTYTITAYNANGSSSTTIDIAISNIPVITFFTPSSAVAGRQVSIVGTGLSGATSVTFGGVAAASVNSNSDQLLSVTVGAGASGAVSVTTPGGTATLNGFTFIPSPVISSFSPLSGSTGTRVTLTGTGFLGATAVSFGGIPAQSFVVNSDLSITAIIGSGASGNVSVTTAGGTITSPGFIFYPVPVITSITPFAAIAQGQITINGSGFTGATAVSFGGTPAQSFNVVSPTTITAVVGSGSSGNVLVVTPGGTATFAGFNFVPVPIVAANGPTTFITGNSVVLTASPGTGYSYQWKKDGADIQGATSASYTASVSGSYTVSITINGTSQVSAITAVTSVFGLAANNFTITVTGATCKGQANGSINIIAAQNLSYTATITGGSLNASYPFATAQNITGLAAATYNVCITVAGQSSYQQCFTLVITEPKDLSVYSVIGSDQKSLVLNLSGGSVYYIQLNGVSSSTGNSQVTLPLHIGTNNLIVTTDKLCQGVIEKTISISDKVIAYPDPFTDKLSISLGAETITTVTVEVYTMDGHLVYEKKFAGVADHIEMDLSGSEIPVCIHFY